MSSIFNRFHKFRKGRSSSSPNLSTDSGNEGSSSSSTERRTGLNAERAAIQKAEVVLMVNGTDGPRAIVPLITTTTTPSNSRTSPFSSKALSPSPLAPLAGAKFPAISPLSPSPLQTAPSMSSKGKAPASKPTESSTPGGIHLLDLPNELLASIAMKSGFFAAARLMLTCKRLNAILDNPSSWMDYTRGGSMDVIESEVTICTKIHTFDHLVFGLWHEVEQPLDQDGNPTVPPPTSSKRAMKRALSSPNLGPSNEPQIYFEHLTFSEQYDFLGGISLGMAPGGYISSEFFDHRETLPCYREALAEAVAQGLLPPSAPHGDPPPGSKIDHSCDRCAKYDGREVLKSLFVFDQVPYHPRWGKEGFSWSYTYPDGRRRLKICIKPFQGTLGYTSVRDLPSLFINCITVDGKQLKSSEYDLFNRLVNGKEKKKAF
ncbi:hypothetical protein HDU97_004118 [Phlyctochytrium planicorne]|nr:hypothetical protein HDU97_004118 [Phlyctochytrium planicorne]